MVNILGTDIPINVNKAAGFDSNTVWLLVFLVFICLVGGIAIFIFNRIKTYRYKIIVFENVAGLGYQVAFRDKARLIKLGDGGEEILYLMKKKTYRTAYGKKMGKNTYWFAVGQDGYWYNVTLGDVDAKMGMLDIEPIDRDMRYMHVAIRKNIQDRYRKQSMMEKYGTYIMSGIFLIIMILGIWFLLDKMTDTAEITTKNIEASGKVVTSAQQIISSLDNICTSSGVKEAG